MRKFRDKSVDQVVQVSVAPFWSYRSKSKSKMAANKKLANSFVH
jgi:hypothetical protein